jgi:hypothetical protein
MARYVSYDDFDFSVEEEEYLSDIRRSHQSGIIIAVGVRALMRIEKIILDSLMRSSFPGMDEGDILEDSTQILFYYRTGFYSCKFDDKYQQFILKIVKKLVSEVANFYIGYLDNKSFYDKEVVSMPIISQEVDKIFEDGITFSNVAIKDIPDSQSQFASQVRVLDVIRDSVEGEISSATDEVRNGLGNAYDACGIWQAGVYYPNKYSRFRGKVSDTIGVIFNLSDDKRKLAGVCRGLANLYFDWLDVQRRDWFVMSSRYKCVSVWYNDYGFRMSYLTSREVRDAMERRVVCAHGRSVCFECVAFEWGEFITWFQDIIRRRFNIPVMINGSGIGKSVTTGNDFIEFCSVTTRQIDVTRVVSKIDKLLYEFVKRYANLSGVISGRSYTRYSIDIVTAIWFNGYSASWLSNMENLSDYAELGDRLFALSSTRYLLTTP